MESKRGRGQGSLWTVEPTEEEEELFGHDFTFFKGVLFCRKKKLLKSIVFHTAIQLV
jgi:hypothetical protein